MKNYSKKTFHFNLWYIFIKKRKNEKRDYDKNTVKNIRAIKNEKEGKKGEFEIYFTRYQIN